MQHWAKKGAELGNKCLSRKVPHWTEGASLDNKKVRNWATKFFGKEGANLDKEGAKSETSRISQPYFRHIAWVSQAYLMGISGISHVYLRHISGISQAYLRHISGISQAYFGHISGISQAYLGYVSSTS